MKCGTRVWAAPRVRRLQHVARLLLGLFFKDSNLHLLVNATCDKHDCVVPVPASPELSLQQLLARTPPTTCTAKLYRDWLLYMLPQLAMTTERHKGRSVLLALVRLLAHRLNLLEH